VCKYIRMCVCRHMCICVYECVCMKPPLALKHLLVTTVHGQDDHQRVGWVRGYHPSSSSSCRMTGTPGDRDVIYDYSQSTPNFWLQSISRVHRHVLTILSKHTWQSTNNLKLMVIFWTHAPKWEHCASNFFNK